MVSHRSRRPGEKPVLSLLLLTFLLPLALTAVVHFTADRPGAVAAWRQRFLDTDPPTVLPFTRPAFADLLSARYQAALATRFNDGYAGRAWVHRATQELYLRLFNTVQGTAILGRNHSAFYNGPPFNFVDEYCVERPPAAALDYIVQGLRLWRDTCRSRGVPFAIVITPSKATYPEDLPAAWRRRFDPRPRAYDDFVRLLQQEHIRYIDGHLLTLAAKPHASAPVFPLGGTHWGQYPALLTANALLRELGSQGSPVRPIDYYHAWVFHDPVDEEADIAELIQPLVPWRYPINRLIYPPVPLAEGLRPSLTIIGGSFVGNLGLHLYRSKQFSEIHWLRYYRDAKELPDLRLFLGWQILRAPIPDFTVQGDVYASQCLVLEVNEQILADPLHLRGFFDDTLARLPGPGTPKDPFHYDQFLPCRWNEPIKFSPAALPTKPGVFSGLCSPDAGGCWSDGPDTTVRLTVPDLDQDVVLSVIAGAAAVPDRRPVQRVTVFANDRPVAEWVHDAGAAQRDEAVIPKALLGDGRLILRFHYSQPTAPAEYSNSPDRRKLALLFGSLTLRQSLRRVDQPLLSATDPRPGASVYAVNFAEAQPFGRWTTGFRSTLRLPVPAGEGDVTLSAEVGALIDDAKLPEQRTSIVVGGQPIGEWVFFHSGIVPREVVVPRALLAGSEMEVEFHFSKTISPAEMGASNDPRHLALLFQSVQLHTFVRDGDAPVAPALDSADGRFQEPFLPCRWNEPLRFSADAMPRVANVFSGLSAPDPAGSWSDGPDTTLRLAVPDVEQDAILSLVAGAAALPNQRPVQKVSVFANDQPVAEWVYDTPAAQLVQAVIPRALLGDGHVVLRFHYSQPTAPSSYSASPDTRRLALFFDNLTLRQPLRRVDGPVISAADPAQGQAVFARGFADASQYGRWTLGASATLNLPLPPPGKEDVVLSAEVGALIDEAKLSEQRASIVVGGQPVGEWVFRSAGPAAREVVIPRAWLHGEKLEVEFRFSKTVSPAQLGLGEDPRPLGLLFKTVQLHWLAPGGTSDPAGEDGK